EAVGSTTTGVHCSTKGYCAYHSGSTRGSSYLIYTNQPFPELDRCSDPFNGPQAPNGDSFADAQVSLVSHEVNEAITNWAGAWEDAAGYENGDECAWVYGVPLGSTGAAADSQAKGTSYNQVIGTGRYYTQLEFSNDDYAAGLGEVNTTGGSIVIGCRQAEEPPTARFEVPASLLPDATIAFDGSASSARAGRGTPLTYGWSGGDGAAAPSAAARSAVCAARTVGASLTPRHDPGPSPSPSPSPRPSPTPSPSPSPVPSPSPSPGPPP